MGKVGYWKYWFKSPDGFDLSFCTNKKDIPKGYEYIIAMTVNKSDGNDDYEVTKNNKIIWSRKNINKLSECEKLQISLEAQKIFHKALNVKYPEKDYKDAMGKKLKKLKLKKCKL
jgi:hypothetical protein